jgi:predicted O-linked N-acetylglucosamine transferase (SPINDLY family)
MQQLLNQARQHYESGRLAEAQNLFKQALVLQPNNADALHLLGVVTYQLGQPGGMELVRRAISLNPRQASYHCNLGVMLSDAGKSDEAVEAYKKTLALQPDNFSAMNNLANIIRSRGQFDEAISLYKKAVALNPNYAEAYNNMGNALREKGDMASAVGMYQKSVSLNPNLLDAVRNLANGLCVLGNLDGSIAMYRQALNLKGDHLLTYHNLATVLITAGKGEEAVVAAQAAVALKPDYAKAQQNLGNALKRAGRFDEALAAALRALQLQPDMAEGYLDLGNIYKGLSRLDEAIAAYDRAEALMPGYLPAATNKLFVLNYSPNYDAPAIFREHQKWDREYAQPLTRAAKPHDNDRSPDRRLRIGYASPDFCRHCQSLFTVPFFSNHDHKNFEIFCYADVRIPDVLTQRLRGYADQWRSTFGKTDAEIAEMIRADRIDILVDLTMHMANARPMVFARKPAPVQVAWLAYPGTTGLSAMDYRFTDPHLDPVGFNEQWYSEKTFRLPDTFWVYDPLTNQPLVNELPALKSGQITFGSLNNFCKVNDPTLELWARVLDRVPRSRVILLCPEGSARARVQEKLGGRAEFVPFRPQALYMLEYHRIDLGLDTFPYNGHTTSLDSLWMGVPVVSMIGNTAVARAAFSQATNLGMADELVGKTPDDFVRIAIELATDIPRLNQMRRTLRPKLQQSPLMDGARFARNMESAYRQIWRNWCQGEK